jgi:hypothetical protein
MSSDTGAVEPDHGSSEAAMYEVTVFDDEMIHFHPDDSAHVGRDSVQATDNGRLIERRLDLPVQDSPVRIEAHLTINPIPKDELVVHDKWDRAGSVRLAVEGSPDIEVVKFITAYGGRSEWVVDVSHLAPLLRGSVTLRAFIDTWVSPAWKVDLLLRYYADSARPSVHWVLPVMFKNSFDRETYDDSGVTVAVKVPDDGQQRVKLHYYASGHCTDGRGADEFVRKDHVIAVDGVVVYRYQPWRDDCRRFRELNPYTRRWSDGWWSSDYSRSGWCPGDVVPPLVLDLTDHLTSGTHTVRFVIENIRPKDENDHFGYWRVSAQLLGLSDEPR